MEITLRRCEVQEESGSETNWILFDKVDGASDHHLV